MNSRFALSIRQIIAIYLMTIVIVCPLMAGHIHLAESHFEHADHVHDAEIHYSHFEALEKTSESTHHDHDLESNIVELEEEARFQNNLLQPILIALITLILYSIQFSKVNLIGFSKRNSEKYNNNRYFDSLSRAPPLTD